MSWEAWFTLVVASLTVILLATDRFNPTMVMIGSVLALLVAGVIDQDQALAGFSNQAPITVAALYVLAGAAAATGALDGLVSRVLGGAREEHPRGELTRICAPSAGISAFIANTPLVAMLAPRVVTWCRRTGRQPSRYLMPLSYAIIFGGCMTMIGTSTNLFVNDLLEDSGQERLDLFDISGIGIPLALGGVLLIILLTPRLLPVRDAPTGELNSRAREFTVEMSVSPGSPLAGQTVAEAGLRNLEGVFLVEIERDGTVLAPVGPEHRLDDGDRLVFVGNVDRVVDLQRIPGLVSAGERHFADVGRHPQRSFVEAVVSGGSRLAGSTLKESGFRARYGSAVVAIHRSGEQLPGKLGDVRLRPGDVLLVLAGPDFDRRFADDRDFAVIAPLTQNRPVRTEHARTVELLILGLIVLAGTDLLDLLQVSLLIAFGLVAFRIITIEEARKSVDVDVILLMATSFGLGSAIQHSGLAAELASGMVSAFDVFGDYGLLFAVLAATMLMTELLSNNAAAAVMFPIAIAAAEQAELDPRPFGVIVLFGATLSFLTPIGYQTNTLVWGMGGYRYRDFARLGAPLTLMVLAATPALVPLFFPLR